jgi:hypothetical protein
MEETPREAEIRRRQERRARYLEKRGFEEHRRKLTQEQKDRVEYLRDSGQEDRARRFKRRHAGGPAIQERRDLAARYADNIVDEGVPGGYVPQEPPQEEVTEGETGGEAPVEKPTGEITPEEVAEEEQKMWEDLPDLKTPPEGVPQDVWNQYIADITPASWADYVERFGPDRAKELIVHHNARTNQRPGPND